MKIKQLFEQALVVDGIRWHFPHRDISTDKLILKPFQKQVEQEMKALNSKWNGQGFQFKTEAEAAIGREAMDQLKAKWKQLQLDYPEGTSNIDSAIADAYFKHIKKNKL
jgi:hypothetical protein